MDRKIVDYQVIWCRDICTLHESVNEYIKKGWEPIGGLAFADEAVRDSYNTPQKGVVQPMVRCEEELKILNPLEYADHKYQCQECGETFTIKCNHDEIKCEIPASKLTWNVFYEKEPSAGRSCFLNKDEPFVAVHYKTPIFGYGVWHVKIDDTFINTPVNRDDKWVYAEDLMKFMEG